MADVKLDIALQIQAQNKILADTQKALGGLVSKLSQTEKQIKSTEDSAVSMGEVFKGSFLAQVAVKGLDLLIDSVRNLGQVLVVDGIKAAEGFQQSLENFNIALRNAGQFTQQASNDFVEFASKVQASTGVADDAILRVGATLTTFGGVSKDRLQEATQAVIDFAAASGKDLETAARIAAQAFSGNTEALRRYGIFVTETTDKSKALNNTLAAFQALGGTAAAQTNTFAGALKVANTAFEDLQKQVGFSVVQNDVIIAGIKQIGVEFTRLTTIVKGQENAFADLATKGFLLFIDLLSLTVNAIDVLYRSIVALIKLVTGLSSLFATAIVGIISEVADLTNSFLQFIGINSKAFQEFVDFLNDLFKSFFDVTKDEFGGLVDAVTTTTKVNDQLSASINNVKSASETAFTNLQNGVKTSGTEAEKATFKVNALVGELTQLAIKEQERAAFLQKTGQSEADDNQLKRLQILIAQKQVEISKEQEHINEINRRQEVENRAAEARKQQAAIDAENEKKRQELIKQGEQIFEQVQNRDPNAKYQKELAALEAFHTQKLEAARKHNENLDALELEFQTARDELALQRDTALAEKQQKEIDDLVARNQILISIDAEKNAALIQQNQDKINKIIEAEGTSQKVKEKYTADEKKRNQQALNERFAQAQQFFNGLAALQETGSRTLFNIGKKAAIAEATVSGVQAVQNALAVKPTPVGIALAAAMAIRTAVNIQKIQAQQFAKGTSFVTGPGGVDNVPAFLSRGERVISKEGNEDLTAFLNSQDTQSEILLEIASKVGAVGGGNIVVEIDGREVALAVKNQIRAGRVVV